MFIDASQHYDVIGDIHGCALTLERLLEQMGYRKSGGVWFHPSRRAIFLGDIIDRGPNIRSALRIVHDMVSTGRALCVMGNHEFNALGWYAPAPDHSGKGHVRERTPRFAKLLAETFTQFEDYPDEWQHYLEWMANLPLFLDGQRFRAVHACWDNQVILQLRLRLIRGRLDRAFMRESAVEGSFAHRGIDRLLRGTDLPLPHGVTLTTEEGFTRSFFRTKFWEEAPRTYGDVVFQPDPLPASTANQPLSKAEQKKLFIYGPNEPMLFVGHYWRQGEPHLIRDNLACLDYSAVRGGKLVAYRLDDELTLDPKKLVWVDVDPGDLQ